MRAVLESTLNSAGSARKYDSDSWSVTVGMDHSFWKASTDGPRLIGMLCLTVKAFLACVIRHLFIWIRTFPSKDIFNMSCDRSYLEISKVTRYSTGFLLLCSPISHVTTSKLRLTKNNFISCASSKNSPGVVS